MVNCDKRSFLTWNENEREYFTQGKEKTRWKIVPDLVRDAEIEKMEKKQNTIQMEWIRCRYLNLRLHHWFGPLCGCRTICFFPFSTCLTQGPRVEWTLYNFLYQFKWYIIFRKKKYFCLYLIRWVHALTRSHLHWQKKFFQLILWLFLLPFNKFIYFSHASSVFEVAQRQKRNIRTETNIRKFRWTFFFSSIPSLLDRANCSL